MNDHFALLVETERSPLAAGGEHADRRVTCLAGPDPNRGANRDGILRHSGPSSDPDLWRDLDLASSLPDLQSRVVRLSARQLSLEESHDLSLHVGEGCDGQVPQHQGLRVPDSVEHEARDAV